MKLCFFFSENKLAMFQDFERKTHIKKITFVFVQIKWKQKYLRNSRTKIAVQALQTMQIRKYDVREAAALMESGGMVSCNRNTNESCVVCLEELLNGQVCDLYPFVFYFVIVPKKVIFVPNRSFYFLCLCLLLRWHCLFLDLSFFSIIFPFFRSS